VFCSFIYSLVKCIFLLTTTDDDQITSLKKLFYWLIAQGYNQHFLYQCFLNAIKKIQHKKCFPFSPTNDTPSVNVYLHMPCHWCDPPSQLIQTVWNQTLYAPPVEHLLPQLTNEMHGSFNVVNLHIVAYHWPHNLNILFLCKFQQIEGQPMSQFLSPFLLQVNSSTSTHN
jgi:hypothetical protein